MEPPLFSADQSSSLRQRELSIAALYVGADVPGKRTDRQGAAAIISKWIRCWLDLPAHRVEHYEIGGRDKRGHKVLDIFWKTEDFVIFQHKEGISAHFSDEEKLSREHARRYMHLGPHLSRINALLPPPEPVDDKKTSARRWSFFHTPDSFLYRETARAIANALIGDHQRAIDILAFVEARLIRRRRAHGQFQYLLMCGGMWAFLVIIAVVCHRLSLLPSPWMDLIQVAACGATGGFLSVAIGIRKLNIDPDTAWWVNGVYGFIRLMIAIVSAVLLYFLIKAKLVLQPVFSENPAQEKFALFAFAAVAGFSETLVPNMFRSAEERSASPPNDLEAK
jgi:hypothetical protein